MDARLERYANAMGFSTRNKSGSPSLQQKDRNTFYLYQRHNRIISYLFFPDFSFEEIAKMMDCSAEEAKIGYKYVDKNEADLLSHILRISESLALYGFKFLGRKSEWFKNLLVKKYKKED